MREYEIIWSPYARIELRNIYYYVYYYLYNPNAAERLNRKIKSAVSTLQHFPEIYSKILAINDRNLRKIVVGNYIIIYEVDNDTRTSFYLTYISR